MSIIASQPAGGRRGFTLLEVLVSLVIFAVAAVALGAAYINVLNAYAIVGRGDTHEQDVRFARAQLLAEPDREKAEEGDDFEATGGGRVRWRSTIEPASMPDLFQVRFVCEISDSTGAAPSRPREETFFVLRPTWSQGVDQAKLREDARQRILELRDQRVP